MPALRSKPTHPDRSAGFLSPASRIFCHRLNDWLPNSSFRQDGASAALWGLLLRDNLYLLALFSSRFRKSDFEDVMEEAIKTPVIGCPPDHIELNQISSAHDGPSLPDWGHRSFWLLASDGR